MGEDGTSRNELAMRLETWFNQNIELYAGLGDSNMTNAYFSGKGLISEVIEELKNPSEKEN